MLDPYSALLLIALVAILGLLTFFVLRRIRTVEEGYVAVVQFMERYSRMKGPGPYFLWPLQDEKVRIFVRTREVSGIGIPNIFTHGGLPLTVMLDYEMRLHPERMSVDERYYTDAMRTDQQVRIFKGIVQRLVQEAARPAPLDDPGPNQVNVSLLFSPFLGQQAADLRNKLESQARGALLDHGVELMAGSLLISWLRIPPDIIAAYTESLAQDFSSASRHKFISRLRDAGTGMSDLGLVHLFNVLEHNPADIRTIFANGGLDPALRIQADDVSLRAPRVGTPIEKSSAPPPKDDTVTATRAAESGDSTESGDNDLPLTEEDMATLRSLID